MNPTLRTLLWIGAGLTLLSTVAMLALLVWLVGTAQGSFDFRFNGEPLVWPVWPVWPDWPDWSGWEQWRGALDWPQWQGAFGAVAAVLFAGAMLVAVPAMFLLALLLGALFSAVGVAGVLLAVALLAAMALSPLWLVVLLLWLVLRRKLAPRAATSP